MIWFFLWQFPIIVSPMKWPWGNCYQLYSEPQLAHLDQKVHHLLFSADNSAKRVSCSRFGLDPRWPEQLDVPVMSVGFANAQHHPSGLATGEESRQCLVCGCVCVSSALLHGSVSQRRSSAVCGKAVSFLSNLCPCPPTPHLPRRGKQWWQRSFTFLVTVVAVTERRNSTLWFLVLWVMLINIVIAIFSGLAWKVIPIALNHDVHACPWQQALSLHERAAGRTWLFLCLGSGRPSQPQQL